MKLTSGITGNTGVNPWQRVAMGANGNDVKAKGIQSPSSVHVNSPLHQLENRNLHFSSSSLSGAVGSFLKSPEMKQLFVFYQPDEEQLRNPFFFLLNHKQPVLVLEKESINLRSADAQKAGKKSTHKVSNVRSHIRVSEMGIEPFIAQESGDFELQRHQNDFIKPTEVAYDPASKAWVKQDLFTLAGIDRVVQTDMLGALQQGRKWLPGLLKPVLSIDRNGTIHLGSRTHINPAVRWVNAHMEPVKKMSVLQLPQGQGLGVMDYKKTIAIIDEPDSLDKPARKAFREEIINTLRDKESQGYRIVQTTNRTPVKPTQPEFPSWASDEANGLDSVELKQPKPKFSASTQNKKATTQQAKEADAETPLMTSKTVSKKHNPFAQSAAQLDPKTGTQDVVLSNKIARLMAMPLKDIDLDRAVKPVREKPETTLKTIIEQPVVDHTFERPALKKPVASMPKANKTGRKLDVVAAEVNPVDLDDDILIGDDGIYRASRRTTESFRSISEMTPESSVVNETLNNNPFARFQGSERRVIDHSERKEVINHPDILMD